MAKNEKNICIIGGAGHIGLPLAIAFADRGYKVTIFDQDELRLETINQGKMPFLEEGAEPLLKKLINKSLFTSSSPNSISNSHFVFMVIGTPLDEHLNPRFVLMKKTVEEYMPHFIDGQIVILRSTISPGTTEKLQKLFRQRGKKIAVTFCPERIVEGKALKEFEQLPQIVSGFDQKSIQEVKKLFSKFNHNIIEVQPIEAELAKLCTNAWRYLKFAIANQFFLIATQNGVSYENLHKAITEKYPRAQDLPKAGFTAGPCLLKDTMQLSAYSNNSFFLGHSAMLINEGLPNYIVSILKSKYSITNKNAGILGMAFKAESDDSRESLSYKLKKILEIDCPRVYCSDEYIVDDDFVSVDDLLEKSDIIIIAAPHKKYRKIDQKKLKNKIVIDIWNLLNYEGKLL